MISTRMNLADVVAFFYSTDLITLKLLVRELRRIIEETERTTATPMVDGHARMSTGIR